MPFVVQLALRSAAGFLVQIVPCAALCLTSFAGRLRGGRRTYALAALICAVMLVPFVIVSTAMLENDLYHYPRLTAQNIVFLAAVAALCALYVRRVDAPVAQKAFVIAVVMCYGYLASLIQYIISQLLNLGQDGYRYPPERLAVMTLVNVALFVPMFILMRYARRIFSAPVESRTWWQMACLPALMIAALLLGGELLPLPNELLYETLRISMGAVTVILIGWALRTVKIVSEDSRRRALLLDALERERTRRAELQSDLAAAHKRVEELEQEAASSGEAPSRAQRSEDVPVVLSSSHQAVSLLPSDIAYVESVNRMRIVHLADGESVRIGSSLGEIFSQLPEGRFAYCHRSVIVNLEMVRSVSSEGITLRDGTPVDTSRRRLPELREALARLQG